jgi:hypothetical protein
MCSFMSRERQQPCSMTEAPSVALIVATAVGAVVPHMVHGNIHGSAIGKKCMVRVEVQSSFVQIQPQLHHSLLEIELVLGATVCEKGALRVEPQAAEHAEEATATSSLLSDSLLSQPYSPSSLSSLSMCGREGAHVLGLPW